MVEQGVCYGVLDVPALARATAVAASALAGELRAQSAVWVSPLQRCEQLAQQLKVLRPDLSFTTDARLAEMNFGTWEGVRWDDIPHAALQSWTNDFGEHRFGDAESANEVLQRVAQAWCQSYEVALQKGTNAVWITHAGVARAAQLVGQGNIKVKAAAQWPETAPAYGRWRVIEPWHSLPAAA